MFTPTMSQNLVRERTEIPNIYLQLKNIAKCCVQTVVVQNATASNAIEPDFMFA